MDKQIMIMGRTVHFTTWGPLQAPPPVRPEPTSCWLFLSRSLRLSTLACSSSSSSSSWLIFVSRRRFSSDSSDLDARRRRRRKIERWDEGQDLFYVSLTWTWTQRDTHFPDELLASSSDSSSLSVSACLRARSVAANIWRDRQEGRQTGGQTDRRADRQEDVDDGEKVSSHTLTLCLCFSLFFSFCLHLSDSLSFYRQRNNTIFSQYI